MKEKRPGITEPFLGARTSPLPSTIPREAGVEPPGIEPGSARLPDNLRSRA